MLERSDSLYRHLCLAQERQPARHIAAPRSAPWILGDLNGDSSWKILLWVMILCSCGYIFFKTLGDRAMRLQKSAVIESQIQRVIEMAFADQSSLDDAHAYLINQTL